MSTLPPTVAQIMELVLITTDRRIDWDTEEGGEILQRAALRAWEKSMEDVRHALLAIEGARQSLVNEVEQRIKMVCVNDLGEGPCESGCTPNRCCDGAYLMPVNEDSRRLTYGDHCTEAAERKPLGPNTSAGRR